jgi:hypothetical protein
VTDWLKGGDVLLPEPLPQSFWVANRSQDRQDGYGLRPTLKLGHQLVCLTSDEANVRRGVGDVDPRHKPASPAFDYLGLSGGRKVA